jgi:hypothetical protein
MGKMWTTTPNVVVDVLLEDRGKCPMTQREVQRSISIRGHGWRIISRGEIKLEAK